MPQGTRDENGNWTVVFQEGDHAPYNDLLTRQLNALDPVFSRARGASEFDFIMCLLRVRGMEDGGNDPYQTTLRAIPLIIDLWEAADRETQKHVSLWLYGHILEASEPYELLANLIRVASRGRYQITTAFPPRGNRQPSPGDKIHALQEMAAAAGLTDAFTPLREVWNRHLRNAAFHADYTIRRESLRIFNPPDDYPWERFDLLINGALAYHRAFSLLYEIQIKSYEEPATIPIPQYFSNAPDHRAMTMIREGHGLIGLKDAWTNDEIRQGQIPFCIGRFTLEESRMHDADPTRALFPAVPAR
jgi:hypothetical protein